MSELRSEWSPQQVQENFDKANETLPEAQTTDRFPVSGQASGVDVRAGEDLYEETAATDASAGSVLLVPPDPPQHLADTGGQ